MSKAIQAKIIPDAELLLAVLTVQESCRCWATHFGGFPNSIELGHPERVVLAKAAKLIKRGLLTGCTCGCRGDFEVTDLGISLLVKSRLISRIF